MQRVAALLSFTILAGTGYAYTSYRHLTAGITHLAGVPGKSGADRDGVAQNILLVGDDHRPATASPQELALLSTGQDGGSTNTDTMMLLHLPADPHGSPTVISFPRDSWVDIPGHGKSKLNAAFAIGAAHGDDAAGMRLLITTIQQMTGLTIDHFVRVSLIGFYDIANTLGPIQVCLNQAVRDPYSGTDLPAGVSSLNAKQALSFVRQRHGLLRGDLDREVRQQYFLSTELRKVASAGTMLNPVKTQALLKAVGSALETDPGLDLLSLASEFSGLSADKVTFSTIPVTGTPTITDDNGNQVSVVQVDFAALPAFVQSVIAGTEPPKPAPKSTAPAAPPVAPSSVTVQVVNGTGTSGLAASASSALQALGFTTLDPANGAAQATTTVAYPPGQQAAARAVAARVPGATVVASSSVRQVTLALGADGIRVAGAAAGAPSSTGGGAASGAAASSAPAPQAFTGGACIN